VPPSPDRQAIALDDRASRPRLGQGLDRLLGALLVADLGIPVLALKHNSKAPATKHGLKDATTDPDRIRASILNGANIGLLWPELALDADDRSMVERLEATFTELAQAPAVDTPRGRHWYLRTPDGWRMPTRAKAVEGLDVRGFGRAYTVAPGSTVDGKTYRVVRPLVRPEDAPVASEALRAYLTPERNGEAPPAAPQRATAPASASSEATIRWAAAALDGEVAKVRAAREGARNNTLNDAAFALGQLVSGGYLTEDDVMASLVDAARGAGLPEREARITAESGMMAGREHPRHPAPREASTSSRRKTAAPIGTPSTGSTKRLEVRDDGLVAQADEALAYYADTDLGNAERLVHRCRNLLRYAPGIGWLRWIGTHWEPDGDRELVLRLASATMRATVATAELLNDLERRKSLRQHARASEALGRLRAMVELARVHPDVHIPADALDADPWRLNVANGLLNLTDGSLEPHDPAALCTRMAPVRYDLDAQHPALDALLEVLARDGRAEYLRAIAGQALTGRSAKALYIWTGPSGTVKSTTADALAAALGPDYAVSVEPSTLLVSRHGNSPGGARADLVALRGARLAIAAELPNGGRLDGELVKRLTGRDPITARAPYAREVMTFTPGHTLVVHSNHDPRIDWTDDGLRARVLPVPFTVRPDNPDPRIRAALIDDPDARAAVLAWAIAGAVAWHRNGERDPEPPELVRRRKVEYLREQDPFAAWADDALEATGDNAFTPTTALAEHYRRWCEANGERPLGTRALGYWLRDNAEGLGIAAGRGADRARSRGWTGLRLRDGGAA
jgi:putative DNA primase/helicase